MSFDTKFEQIRAKLNEGTHVQMTPMQFEKMCYQFYIAGVKSGRVQEKKEWIATGKLINEVQKNKPKEPLTEMIQDMFNKRK